MLVDKDTNILEDYYKRSNMKKFPTFVALLSLLFGWLLNIITLAWVHDRVPMDRAPLPDLFFSLFPEIPEAIRITEIIMLFMIVNCLVVIYLHQHRWIVARRVFFCVAVSYVFRAICITIFQVPVPSTKTFCAPQTSGGLSVVVDRVLQTFWSAGIEALRPRVLCGDLIVSGHTISLFTALHAFKYYSPKKVAVIEWLYRTLAFIAIICILLSRKHYTIDVFLGYVVATNVFRTYHSLMHSYHQNELEKNLHSQNWLTPAVVYFEKDALPPYLFSNVLQFPKVVIRLCRKDSN